MGRGERMRRKELDRLVKALEESDRKRREEGRHKKIEYEKWKMRWRMRRKKEAK